MVFLAFKKYQKCCCGRWPVWYQRHRPGDVEINWSQKHITWVRASRFPRISHDTLTLQLRRSSTEINDWVCTLSRFDLIQTHTQPHAAYMK